FALEEGVLQVNHQIACTPTLASTAAQATQRLHELVVERVRNAVAGGGVLLGTGDFDFPVENLALVVLLIRRGVVSLVGVGPFHAGREEVADSGFVGNGLLCRAAPATHHLDGV